ncbi:venom protease [Condylostylus longicornis]|uniref:venom protease n=1 Tax=Condylostylus longicornis TaxID=2530218 RepID=UPI00244E4948|nr:venom protease [Condylostylus longicornis]
MYYKKISYIIMFLINNYLILGTLSQSDSCLTSAKRQGQCTSVENCPNLIEEYFYKLQTTPITFDAFLRTITCEISVDAMKICCPNRMIPKIPDTLQILSQSAPSQQPKVVSLNQPGVSIFSFSALNYNSISEVYDESLIVPLTIIGNGPLTSNTAKPILQPINIKLQPGVIPKSSLGQCGMNTLPQTRIVGGNEVKKGSYPWIAALGYIISKNDPAEFLCGGSLITTRHVLTAAHCVNNDLAFARLGTNNISGKEPNSIDIKILKKFQHEQYNINSNANDIGLLRLEKDIDIADHIMPICLPYGLTKDLVGMNPFIAGWGAQKFRGTTTNILREAQIQIVSLAECKKNYSTKFIAINFDDKIICAGGNQIDSCQGDSGGPLMLPQLDPVKIVYYYYLIGVVSFGFECAVPGFPGVYTKVNSYLTWIENKVKL